MKTLAFLLALVALLLPACTVMTAVDKVALHNAHVGASVIRSSTVPAAGVDKAELATAQDGEEGVLLRLDTKFNGPEVATSTALLPLPAE